MGRDLSKELFGDDAPASTGRDLTNELFGAPSTPPAPAPGGISPDMAQAATQAQQRMDAPITPLQPGQPPDWKGAAGLAINMALPAAAGKVGAALAPMVGRAVAPLVGRATPAAAEIVASAGAREVNKAIGAEQPGLLGDVAAVAVPTVVRTAQALRKPALSHLPGASATAHAEGAERLATLAPEPSGTAVPAVQQQLEALAPGTAQRTATQQGLEAMRPPAGQAQAQIEDVLTRWQPATPSAQLYAPLHGDTTPIRPSNIYKAALDVSKREQALQPTFRDSRVAQVAGDLRALVQVGKGQIPLNTLVEHQQRLGLLIRQASAENWPQTSALKQLYSAFYKDIDYAASQGVAGAAQFRQAAATARREFALEDLRTMMAPGSPGVTTTPQGTPQLPGGTQLERSVAKKRLQDDLFRESFTPAEWLELNQHIKTAQSHEAVTTFLDKLQAGKPGIVTDPATGTTSIGDIRPIRAGFEQTLQDNPLFAAATTQQQVTQLRQLFVGAEREQALAGLSRHLRPGQPGVSTDTATGALHIDNIRPVRTAFEKEMTDNPALAQALGPQVVRQLREGLFAAETEQAQTTLAQMMRPGGSGIGIRPDGLITINAGKMREAFEKRLGNDKDFAAMLPAATRDEVRKTLGDLERLPRIPPSRGQNYGSAMMAGRGTLAYGITQYVTGDPLTATVAGAAAVALPHYIAQGLMTPTGRKWLLTQLAKEGGISPAALGLASGGGRQAIEQGTTVENQRVP